MIVFDGNKAEGKVVLETKGAIGDGWDFCSTKEEDILMTHQGRISQAKLTREIWVCEITQETLQKN
jgi:hypothetical protein